MGLRCPAPLQPEGSDREVRVCLEREHAPAKTY